MKFTNKYNYPQEVFLAVTEDTYDKGDSEFSATGLIKPPRIVALEKKHDQEMEIDIDDRIFILYGHVGHTLLERAGKKLQNRINEVRYFGTIDGVKISAQVDSLSLVDGVLADWKFTTVYGFKIGTEPKDEWVRQMNIQLELLRQNDMDANKLQIWGLLRDWRPGESKREKGYPTKLGWHDIEIYPREKTRAMISEMIKAHRKAEAVLPLCTKEENWSGRRCIDYCDVNKYCSQYKESINGRY